MVVSRTNHFYIYEPVQVLSGQLVVPIFFYQQNNQIMAKCLCATVEQVLPNLFNILIDEDPAFDSQDLLTINVKSFWRSLDSVVLDGGVRLGQACGNHIYCELLHASFKESSFADYFIFSLEHTTTGVNCVPLVNLWRTKAHGRIIRHVPLALYSDDTSGNVSKKYNKHMSIYFTLAGLSPAWSNQEYNTHFLATTNCATALELFDQVVDEIK
jgi:hypothetical protein